MKTNIRLTVTALLFTFLVVGCAPIQKASNTLDSKARQFSPPPGRAAVYVIRPNQFIAAGAAVPVFIDHAKFGRLPPKSFLYGEVLPREHILELAELSGAKNTSLRFRAEEGRCHFFFAKVVLGGLTLEALSDDEGKRLVGTYDLSGDNTSDFGDASPITPN